MVVLGITVILASILMPALRHARSNVDRLASAANLRSIGYAMTAYDRDNMNRLPYSYVLQVLDSPSELTTIYTDESPDKWDGLGLLYFYGYLGTPESMFAPSYQGQNSFESYAPNFQVNDFTPLEVMHSNFHYGGHIDWESGAIRRLTSLKRLTLATDGFRARSELNHDRGLNRLHTDVSVSWSWFEPGFVEQLPSTPAELLNFTSAEFSEIWKQIEDPQD